MLMFVILQHLTRSRFTLLNEITPTDDSKVTQKVQLENQNLHSLHKVAEDELIINS